MKEIRKRFMQRKRLGKKGFTLIELIIVIVMLVALASIAIPAVSDYLDKANSAKALANGRSVYTALSAEAASEFAKGTATITGATLTTVIDNAKAIAKVPSTPTITGNIVNGTISSANTFKYVEGIFTVDFDANGNIRVRKTSEIGS